MGKSIQVWTYKGSFSVKKLLCAFVLVSCLGFLNSVWAGHERQTPDNRRPVFVLFDRGLAVKNIVSLQKSLLGMDPAEARDARKFDPAAGCCRWPEKRVCISDQNILDTFHTPPFGIT